MGRWIRRTLLAAFIAAILAVGWGFLIEPGRLVVRDHAIRLKDWPAALAGYRIVLLTDLHVGSPHITLDRLREIVAETNAQAPHLILLGGDYVMDDVPGGEKIGIEAIAPVLAGLRARDGVFGVLGNHDNWNDGPHIAAAMEANGIAMLNDEAVQIAAPDAPFWLAGVSDFMTDRHDVARALAGIGEGPVIVLTHSPDVFPDLPGMVTLGVAGHTHGGQVDLPLLGPLVVPSIYGRRYAAGLIEEGGMTFFAGTGIGTSILPVRFLVPPEISVLKVEPAP